MKLVNNDLDLIFREANRQTNSSGMKGQSINSQVELNSIMDPNASAMNVYGLDQPPNSRILTGQESVKGSNLKMIDMEEVKRRNESKQKNQKLFN